MASEFIETVTGTLSVPIFSRTGQQVGTVDVDANEFGGKISPRLMHEAVLMYQANARAGTHSTLRRGEVAGSTKKIFKQKGTGNARAGTKRTNKRRGGGTAKGPKPRDYSYSLPRRAVRAATRMAILSKIKDNQAIVIDDFGLGAIKTKEVAGMLNALKLKGVTCLIGTENLDPIIYKSARNIEGVKVLPAGEFNTYIVLRQKRLVLTKAALESLRKPKA
ncbi:MAG: 50S ribosomal protein L4 [Planctomycetes bacterium]|nr:50S ribosomal protein L4 [Planctomycetota bacterium]